MPYQYSVIKQDNYLRVEVSGSREGINVAQASLQMWTEVAATCRSKNIDHILAIFHLSGKRSLLNTLDIVDGVKSMVWPELMIAYVDTDPDNKQQNAIAEDSAMSHGINFRTFETEEEGRQWLLAFSPA
ncbi:hypothetical protein [Amphritea sp. HPY]|uniref:hypothetical protein n=1 Tax=Amphritea sp. HPY TaxID=3421652 RepID=UPI003D7F0A18